jgi:hypothetical protein
MCRKLIYLVSFVLMLGLVAVVSGAEGLQGQYYHGTAGDPWRTLVLERIDPTVDFNWGGGSPDPSVNADGFTARWTGMIEVPSSNTYTFHTQTDDGVRLWVNGQPVINNWTDHSNTHDSGDIALKAGQKYEIILEYYENGGDAVCELTWSTPSLTREAIPSQYTSVERPYARRPDPADGTMLRDTWVSISWTAGDYAASHDVYLGENFNDVAAGTGDTFQGNQTGTYFTIGFPGFPYPDGLVPGTTYYWRIDEVEAKGTTKYKGPVWSFSIAPKIAFTPNPGDGAEFVDPNVVLKWEPGFGAMLHHIYFGDNFADVNNGTGNAYKGPVGFSKYTPGTLKSGKAFYWRVDEFDGLATHKGDVWGFTTPGAVGSPKPSHGAVDVKQAQILKWSPGDNAVSHQVYFGTDKDAVRNANSGSPEYKGTKDLGSESYDPGKLQWDTTYYWRVDGVNNANPNSPWVGLVWSFTTADFLIVDDFEDYDIGSNEIWWLWKDGLGYAAHGNVPAYPGNGTGAAVGDESTGSYCEETIIHGGSQSMPLFYDNNMQGKSKYSEAELTLTYPRDWTENGVNTLTIWFMGSSANTAAPLYVALNGSAVVSHDNPNASQIATWTQWNIDLQVFADQGVNLTNVNTIALGLGNKKNPVAGGSGTMYFDDIGLYPPPPEPAQ